MRFLIVLFFSIGLWSFSDAQEKLINGRIIIDIENESADGIYVTNSRTGISAVTDLTGSFTLHAQEGDELLIRSYIYESRKFILGKNVFNSKLVTIHLNLQPIILDEAVLTKKLTGYLDIDAKYDPSKDKIAKLYKDLGFNPDAGKTKDSTALLPWNEYEPFKLNVEGLFGAITGDNRRKRNLNEFEDREKRIQNIKDYFGESYFVDDLNIPKEKIREFVFFSFETTNIPEHYMNGNYLSIMLELGKSSKVYLRRLNFKGRSSAVQSK
ncbi:MAG: hypothetical protein WCY16_10845 [Weeksellaceae bacterium]